MAHTPGPWHINGECWVGFDRNNSEAGGYQFCAVAHVMERVGCTQANARLIAAAPDLLEECRLAARCFDGLFQKAEAAGHTALVEACREVTQRLRAAIAKAE